MDEEVEIVTEDVNSVLAQESSELLCILSAQSPEVTMKLCQMMPSDAGVNINPLPSSSDAAAALTENVKAMLEYFIKAEAADCCHFLQSLCLLCENIPMRLDSRLMSVAGYAKNVGRPSNPSGADGNSSSPPTQQLMKRLRIDHWEQYIAAVMDLLQKRWERLRESLVRDVQLEDVWVGLRPANRVRERPRRTLGSADKDGQTPDPDWDYGSMDSRVTLGTFFKGCTGKVTVLVGRAGSGKTLLMSCLGQQWARGVGLVPPSYLFVLLEFRQLSILSCPLTLSELLFRHYLPLKGNCDQKKAIVDYLLSNPEKSCWVLDGYDDFSSKLAVHQVKREPLHPGKPRPVADLISGLLHRRLLPGCTVVVTCRARNVINLEGVSDKVGQIVGWGCREIKEYVENYFQLKGHPANRALGMQAAECLLSSQHLLAMSTTPSLCNICCICLEHLLLEGRLQVPGECEKRSQTPGGEEDCRGESNVQNQVGGREDIDGTIAQIPSTLTQVYLTVLGAFLSRDSDSRGSNAELNTTRVPLSTACTSATRYGSELYELCRLAWNGLEEGKILFKESDISPDVLEFAIRTEMLSKVALRSEDGLLVNFYCFIHLTLQEFLAALTIMSSADVCDEELKRRFSLRTRWLTKSVQRTIFTDSLLLYVCGLASPNCTQTLIHLQETSVGTGDQSWVLKRQNLVLKLLSTLCQSTTLTGPKLLELCHCLQESQNHQLAKQVVDTRPILELRNIQLTPSDIDALAFVANSSGDSGIGLDFRSCSMDTECVNVLPRCQHLNCLSFSSRKYCDRFAEKLARVLPKFTALRKLEFCGASLTATGAASLASALQSCPHITEINLSDNYLSDRGIQHIADVFTKLPRLVSVMLGQKNSSLKAVDHLIGKICSCLNIQQVHANGMKELTVTFSQPSNSLKTKCEPEVQLLNQKWSKSEMQAVAKSLAGCPALSVLDISGGYMDAQTLKTFAQFLPKFNVTRQIIANNSCTSVEGLVILTAVLSDCPAVVELRIRLQIPLQVSILFPGAREKPANDVSRSLCLSCCDLLPPEMDRVWRSLGANPRLTLLDLSGNRLGNKGLVKLLDFLPRLSSIQEINASNNGIGKEGVVMLAAALCSHDNLKRVLIGDGDRVILTFCPDKRDHTLQQKMFRIYSSSLLSSCMSAVCKQLVKCRSSLELDLSHSSLTEMAVENLLAVLPNMKSLQRLNVSHSVTSTTALLLVRSLSLSQRITSVELRPQSVSFIHFDSVKAEQASFRLTDCSLKGDNLERLLELLQRCPQLSHLDLSSNQLEDEGVKRFVDSLQRLNISSYVNLSNNGLSQQGLLDVVGTLCTCPSVSRVELSLGAEQRVLIWFSQYEGCGKTLSLVDCAVDAYQLASMSSIILRCLSLTELDVSHNNVSTEGAEFLCSILPSLPNLTSLSIGSKQAHLTLNEKLSQALLQAAAIQHLNLSGHVISDGAAQVMTRMLPRLRSLTLCPCEWSAAGGLQLIKALGKCVSLEVLCLDSLQLNEELQLCLAQALRHVSSLRCLKLNKIVMRPSQAHGVLDLLSAMEGLTLMEEIELEGWRMADEGVEQLITLFPVWKEIKKISLSKNLISDQSGDSLLEALGSCSHLEELYLSTNHLGDVTAARMAFVLPSLTHITVLDVSDNKMGSEGSASLSKAMRHMRKLTKIHLTSVGTSELCAVAASLAHCPLIQDVGLGWNNCGDEVAEELARVMPVCQKLIRIDLESNKVTVSGAESLVRALELCPGLQIIRLWRNDITPSEAQGLSLRDQRLNFSSWSGFV